MNVLLIGVVSLDGKTADAQGETHTWTSAEDWDEFVRLRDASEVIVMDAQTYEAVKPQPDTKLLRVVLASSPEKYQSVAVPGQLEFVTETPKALVERLSRAGRQKLMVAGSMQINSDFLAAGLVSEVYLTFEPVLLGKGAPLLAEHSLQINLTLQSVRQLNERGTLLARYLVN